MRKKIIFAFIFARKNSKRLKNKNLRKIGKKSLIEKTINLAKSIKEVDEIFVSSDSKKILNTAKKLNVNIIPRPSKLADDLSKEILSWKHAIKFVQNNKINFDYFLSLPTTSPLKSKKDIKKLIKVFCKNRSDITMTVTKSNVSPNFNIVLKKKNGQIKILKSKNRFTLDKVFNLTTVGYIAKTQYIMKNMNLFSEK